MPKNNKEVGFSIINWAAFAPGLNTKEDWQEWALGKKEISAASFFDWSLTPVVDFLPPMQRRRLSQLTKMSLKVAHDCAEKYQDVEAVFASRYGELGQTLKLLKSISDQEEFSPAGFSLSVHNAGAGLYSLTNQNSAPYTAIAASELTFEAALIEAVGRLQHNKNVLLVVAEEYVPELNQSDAPFAVAFLLGLEHQIKIIRSIKKDNLNENRVSENMALNFLKWFLENEGIFFTNLYQIKRND